MKLTKKKITTHMRQKNSFIILEFVWPLSAAIWRYYTFVGQFAHKPLKSTHYSLLILSLLLLLLLQVFSSLIIANKRIIDVTWLAGVIVAFNDTLLGQSVKSSSGWETETDSERDSEVGENSDLSKNQILHKIHHCVLRMSKCIFKTWSNQLLLV